VKYVQELSYGRSQKQQEKRAWCEFLRGRRGYCTRPQKSHILAEGLGQACLRVVCMCERPRWCKTRAGFDYTVCGCGSGVACVPPSS